MTKSYSGGRVCEHANQQAERNNPTMLVPKLKPIIIWLVALSTWSIVVICRYSVIGGKTEYFYGAPSSWQFCTVYSSSTIQAYDQKMIDTVVTICMNLGLQILIFTWIGLAVMVRAFAEKDAWLRPSCVFLIFNIFNQLFYYESTPLVIFPSTLVTSLVALTNFLLNPDLYNSKQNEYCFNFEYRTYGLRDSSITNSETVISAWYRKYPEIDFPNCTTTKLLYLGNANDFQDKEGVDLLVSIANNTLDSTGVNCEAQAQSLNNEFLAIQYLLVITSTCFAAFTIQELINYRKIGDIYSQRRVIDTEVGDSIDTIEKADVKDDDEDANKNISDNKLKEIKKHKCSTQLGSVVTPSIVRIRALKLRQILSGAVLLSCAVACGGYILTAMAKLDASLIALESSQDWPLVNLEGGGMTKMSVMMPVSKSSSNESPSLSVRSLDEAYRGDDAKEYNQWNKEEDEHMSSLEPRMLPNILHRPTPSPTITQTPTNCDDEHPLNPIACKEHYVEIDVDVEYRYTMSYSINGYLPSKKVFINLEVIFLLSTTMFAVKQNWRVVLVTSLLFIVTSWPIIIGNCYTMHDNHLWPAQNEKACYDYFSGKALLYPSRSQSIRLCRNTQVSVIGGLFSFVAMNLIFLLSGLLIYIEYYGVLSMTDLFNQFQRNVSSGWKRISKIEDDDDEDGEEDFGHVKKDNFFSYCRNIVKSSALGGVIIPKDDLDDLEDELEFRRVRKKRPESIENHIPERTSTLEEEEDEGQEKLKDSGSSKEDSDDFVEVELSPLHTISD